MFEEKLLADTSSCYSRFASEWLLSYSSTDYILKVFYACLKNSSVLDEFVSFIEFLISNKQLFSTIVLIRGAIARLNGVSMVKKES